MTCPRCKGTNLHRTAKSGIYPKTPLRGEREPFPIMRITQTNVENAMKHLWEATKIFSSALEDAGPYGWNLIINGERQDLCTGKTLREVYDYLHAFTKGAQATLRELEEREKESPRYREVAGLSDVDTESEEGLEAAGEILDRLEKQS